MTEESPQQAIDPSERIAAAFAQLTESAKHVNRAKFQLGRPINALQNAVRKLEHEVPCWLKMAGETADFDGSYWREDVGFARYEGKWSFVVKESSGTPFSESEETFLLNDAPQHLRLKAIDMLPELLEAMVKATDAATKRLTDKVAPTERLVEAVGALTNAPKKK